jgi:hypothetical protein
MSQPGHLIVGLPWDAVRSDQNSGGLRLDCASQLVGRQLLESGSGTQERAEQSPAQSEGYAVRHGHSGVGFAVVVIPEAVDEHRDVREPLLQLPHIEASRALRAYIFRWRLTMASADSDAWRRPKTSVPQAFLRLSGRLVGGRHSRRWRLTAGL